MTYLPEDLDRALYAELINRRPSPVDNSIRWQGPTAAFADLQLQRGLWAVAAELEDDEEAA